MCASYWWLSVQNDDPVEVTTLKDELPDPRGSLANDIPSYAIEQANQRFDKTTTIHNMRQTKRQIHT